MTAKKKKLDELETASGKTPKKRGRPKKKDATVSDTESENA